VKFAGQVLEGLDPKELRGLLDQAKQRLGSGVAVIVAVNEGRASIAAAVTEDLAGKVSAVDLVRAASRRWAARAAVAVPTWPRAAARMATRPRRR
jgi:alanyl-tRNA synthetase